MAFDPRALVDSWQEQSRNKFDPDTYQSYVDEIERQRKEWLRRNGKTPKWQLDLTPFQFNLAMLNRPEFRDFEKQVNKKFYHTQADIDEAKQNWKPGDPYPAWMNKRIEANFAKKADAGRFPQPTAEDLKDAASTGLQRLGKSAASGFMTGASGLIKKIGAAGDILTDALVPGAQMNKKMYVDRTGFDDPSITRPLSTLAKKVTAATEGEAEELSRHGIRNDVTRAMVEGLTGLAGEGVAFALPMGKLLMPILGATGEYAETGTLLKGLTSGSVDQMILDAAKFIPGGSSKAFSGFLRKFAAGAGFAGKQVAESAIGGDGMMEWSRIDKALPAFTLAFVMEKSKEAKAPTITLKRTIKNLEAKAWALTHGDTVNMQKQVADALANGTINKPSNRQLKRYLEIATAHHINEKAANIFTIQMRAANQNYHKAKAAIIKQAAEDLEATGAPPNLQKEVLRKGQQSEVEAMKDFAISRRTAPEGENIRTAEDLKPFTIKEGLSRQEAIAKIKAEQQAQLEKYKAGLAKAPVKGAAKVKVSAKRAAEDKLAQERVDAEAEIEGIDELDVKEMDLLEDIPDIVKVKAVRGAKKIAAGVAEIVKTTRTITKKPSRMPQEAKLEEAPLPVVPPAPVRKPRRMPVEKIAAPVEPGVDRQLERLASMKPELPPVPAKGKVGLPMAEFAPKEKFGFDNLPKSKPKQEDYSAERLMKPPTTEEMHAALVELKAAQKKYDILERNEKRAAGSHLEKIADAKNATGLRIDELYKKLNNFLTIVEKRSDAGMAELKSKRDTLSINAKEWKSALDKALDEGSISLVVDEVPKRKYKSQQEFNSESTKIINFLTNKMNEVAYQSGPDHSMYISDRNIVRAAKRAGDHEGVMRMVEHYFPTGRKKSAVEVSNIRMIDEVVDRLQRTIATDAATGANLLKQGTEARKTVNTILAAAQEAKGKATLGGKGKAEEAIDIEKQRKFIERFYEPVMSDYGLIDRPGPAPLSKEAQHSIKMENESRVNAGMKPMTEAELAKYIPTIDTAFAAKQLATMEKDRASDWSEGVPETPPNRADYELEAKYKWTKATKDNPSVLVPDDAANRLAAKVSEDAYQKDLARYEKARRTAGSRKMIAKEVAADRKLKNVEERTEHPEQLESPPFNKALFDKQMAEFEKKGKIQYLNAGPNPTEAFRKVIEGVKESRMIHEGQSALFPLLTREGELTGSVFIEEMANQRVIGERMGRRYQGYRNVLQRLDKEVINRIREDFERGRPINPVDAKLFAATANATEGGFRGKKKTLGVRDVQLFFNDIHNTFNDLYKQMKALDVDVEFWENYYPHLWASGVDPRVVIGRTAWRGKGTQGYTKHRGEGMDTVAEAKKTYLATTGKELKMKFENPVDEVLYQMANMQKLITTKTVINKLKSKEIGVVYDRVGQMPHPGPGWEKLRGRAGDIIKIEDGLPSIVGERFALKGAADVINNYNSASLSEGKFGNVYDNVRRMTNFINNIQLNASAFHLGFTTMDVMFGHFGLGFQKLTSKGFRAEGAGEMLTAFLPTSVVTNAMKGRKFGAAIMADSPNYAREIKTWIMSGSSFKMSSEYRNNAIRRYKDALAKHQYLRALGKAPFAAIEAMAYPIMEKIVPMQKMGLMLDQIKFIQRKADLNHWTPQKIRLEAQKAQKSIDDRMGQIGYDNRFWDRGVRSAAFLAVRSVGWNVGTLDVFGASAKNLIQMGAHAAKIRGAPKVEMHPSLGYAAGLVFGTALYGALYQAASTWIVNGKPEMPSVDSEGLFSLFFPKTGRLLADGNPERVSLPTYIKDLFAFENNAFRTISHKLHPAWPILLQMIDNKDYWQYQITDPNDDLAFVKRWLWYPATQLTPFSISNLKTRLERGAPPLEASLGFVGITPAAKAMTNRPIENDVQAMYNKFYGSRFKSFGQRAEDDAKQELRNLMREKRYDEADRKASEFIGKGVLTKREWENVIETQNTSETMTERMFKRLPLDVKQQIFDENKNGMTPHELQVYGAILRDAINRGQ